MMMIETVERLALATLKMSGVIERRVATSVGDVFALDVPGSGPQGTLVLQHGIGAASSLNFVPMFRRLKLSFGRIVALDLSGHGRSATPTRLELDAVYEGFRDALDELAPESKFLYGNSLGGAMVTQYAAERSESVRGLFLTSPAGAPMTATTLPIILNTFAMRDRRATLDFLDKLYFRRPLVVHLIASEIQKRFQRPTIRGILDSLQDGTGFNPSLVRGLRLPITLWWPDADRIMPTEFRDWWLENLPSHAVVERPEGVSHCPHLDRPAFTAAAITQSASYRSNPKMG